MPIIAKVFPASTVPNAKGTIISAGTNPSETLYLTRVTFAHSNAATQTLQLWYLPNGGSSVVLHPAISLPQNWSAVLSNVVLNPGDAIEAATTTNAVVAYTPMGGVEA